MGFERLSNLLGKIQAKYPALQKRLREAEAVGRWDATVGAMIAKHARAFRVHEGVLWVEVDHSIWRSELHHRKRQILDALNAGIPRESEEKPLIDILFLDPRKPLQPGSRGTSPVDPSTRKTV